MDPHDSGDAPPQEPTAEAVAAAMMAELDILFDVHKPVDEQLVVFAQVRARAKSFAAELLRVVPHSIERNAAMRCLQETVFWANAATARRWPTVAPDDPPP